MPGKRVFGFSLLLVIVLALLLQACSEAEPRPVMVSPLPSLAPTYTPLPPSALLPAGKDEYGRTTVTARLVGSGSTFADPIYRNWISQFAKASPNVKIDYQATGSGAGRSAFLGTPVPTVGALVPVVPNDFAGSDSPFRGSELLAARNKGEILHIPTAAGAVVAVYNLKEAPGLKLSGPVLAAIFLGKITRWNDVAIRNDNPDQKLPDKEIRVVIRAKDGPGSGTSEIFTRYLSVVSDEFRDQVGPGSSPKWTLKTTREGGRTLDPLGNDGVAAAVRDTDGALGYADQGVADELKLTYASIRNKTGRYILPTQGNISAAVQGSFIPDDFRTFIVNSEGENAYPISGFTWIITWRNLSLLPSPSKEKAQGLVTFLWWSIHDGQRNLPAGYAPLPDSLIPRLEQLFITGQDKPEERVFSFNNQPLLPQLGKS